MVRWWIKLPIIIVALGVLAVLIAGAPNPSQNMPQQRPPNLMPPDPSVLPQSLPPQPSKPWWQEPTVLVAVIGVIGTIVVALIQRGRATPPVESAAQQRRSKS
jgi:hypothetical protein